MHVKPIIFEGKPGTGPEPETDPEPFGGAVARAEALIAGDPEWMDKPQPAQPVAPVKRGPGRPRKAAQ